MARSKSLSKLISLAMSSGDDDSIGFLGSNNTQPETWLPPRNLWDTNWIYHANALRIYDAIEMDYYFQSARSLLEETNRALLYVFVIWCISLNEHYIRIIDILNTEFVRVINIVHLLHSETYYSFANFLNIGYCSFRNRMTSSFIGTRFPDVRLFSIQ